MWSYCLLILTSGLNIGNFYRNEVWSSRSELSDFVFIYWMIEGICELFVLQAI